MKKGVFLFVVLALVLIAYPIAAANDTECGEGDNTCKKAEAKACLNSKIDDKGCSVLSSEERIFSALAVGECKNEIKEDSKLKSDVKFTAQSLLVSGSNDEKEWLLSQNRSSTGLNWFLEIESPSATECSVSYSGTNNVKFDEDKKITFLSGGSCLKLAQGGYWLEVSSECYDEEFTISCDQSFLTTLLYQKQGTGTIFVSESTNSASADGTTKEKVNSFCFAQGGSCNYEATLWASLVLSFLKEDVSFYLPYLIALKEDNENLLPEAFLYYLTTGADFKNALLSEQISNSWWTSLNDKYYGTALALFSLQFDEPQQKTDSITWLFNAQDENGCWDSGNIKSTAFILYAMEPRALVEDTGGVNCEAAGYTCSSESSCIGDPLSTYSCSGGFVCCNEVQTYTCAEKGGEICNSNQECKGIGSLTKDVSGLETGQACCVSGSCQDVTNEVSACKSSNGECRANECLDGEEKNELSCDFSTDICCVQKQKTETNYFWVWFFLILIILVIIAIVFREKLRPYWIRVRSKFKSLRGSKSSSTKGPGPKSPPLTPPLLRRPPARRMPNSLQRHSPRARPAPREKSEIDDVLKKLKDMGK
jgi:hypothetical protein